MGDIGREIANSNLGSLLIKLLQDEVSFSFLNATLTHKHIQKEGWNLTSLSELNIYQEHNVSYNRGLWNNKNSIVGIFNLLLKERNMKIKSIYLTLFPFYQKYIYINVYMFTYRFMIYICKGPLANKSELKSGRSPSPYRIKQSLCWVKTVKYITCCETST